MFPDVVSLAHGGAGYFVQSKPKPETEAFEHLPVNLSAEEIRAMVLDILG